jgi:hypothetical protein
MSVLPFAPSIAILSLVQASIIALPARTTLPIAERLANRWWGLVLPGSIVVVIGGIALDPALADFLTYLALVAVPALAALALAAATKGSRPALAAIVPPLFILAATVGGLTAQAAALALSALACVALGVLVASLVPPRWLKLAIYAMAIIDTYLVGADLLQNPNLVLEAAAPAGGLPQLQFAQLGTAVIGFGDLFIAAVLGALLAGSRSLQLRAALLAAGLALAFDLLFFFVAELPSTVPIALTLAILELREWSSRRVRSRGPRAAAA